MKFAQPSHYGARGRNGSFDQFGVHVYPLGDEVMIRAISSRGVSDAARIMIPRAELPAFIAELQAQLPFQPGARVSVPDGTIHTIESVDSSGIYLSNGDRWTAADLKEMRP